MKDLIILVADSYIRAAMLTLIKSRKDALGIKTIELEERDVPIHPHHDPGVYREAHEFLRTFLGQYQYALVVFDHHGCGARGISIGEIQEEVQQRLNHNGWENRSGVIVIEPELETWVWSNPSHVAKILNLEASSVKNILESCESSGHSKPQNPKEAWERALEKAHQPKSSSLYKKLAQTVSLRNCNDTAFQLMNNYLRKWFPARSSYTQES